LSALAARGLSGAQCPKRDEETTRLAETLVDRIDLVSQFLKGDNTQDRAVSAPAKDHISRGGRPAVPKVCNPDVPTDGCAIGELKPFLPKRQHAQLLQE